MAGIARDDRARAELAAAALATRAKERGSVPKHREETVSEWFTRWTTWRALSRVSDAKKQADQNGQGSAFGAEMDLYAILEAAEAAGAWPSPGGDA